MFVHPASNNESDVEARVIAVKTTRPEVPASHIDRSDILMAALASSPVAMLLAPAGYGKTSVISSSISLLQMDHTVVYYQCDRFDESPRLMVRACEEKLGLAAQEVSSSLSDMEAVATLLEHVRQRNAQFVLIIDNVEYLDFEESRA
ncbi:MAG: AAA family ATPase, partial [Pseudomonadota bacterium]|nr:AAA family ATPase [Pseudomonadota bacterium]